MIRSVPDQQTLRLEDSEFAADPRDWVVLRLLLEELDEELREQRKLLLMRLAQWIMAHDLFRKIERRRMVQSKPSPRDLEYHDVFASMLEGSGKMLLLAFRDHVEVDPSHLGMSFEDVRAAVIAVERDRQQWHSGMTEERRTSILQDVFG